MRAETERTELAAAERRLERRAEQGRRAQEADRLRRDFLAGRSHEMRTSLNAIFGFSELLRDGRAGEISELQAEFLDDILAGSSRLLELIDEVLDYAKREPGTPDLQPEPIAPAALVAEVLAAVSARAAARGIDLELRADPALGTVTLDPDELRQVVYEYLANAIRLTSAGGRVTVRLQPEGDDRFRLEVEDTGVGIPPEDLDRLFTRLQPPDPRAAERPPGAGLGLARIQRSVEAQGGAVGVRSTAGVGSVFWAVLPRNG